ncbi:TPA: sugar phosphate isomerase/epimerase [bacterium]|nr:sugar phosphate isomerase/epimerase [bacterium]
MPEIGALGLSMGRYTFEEFLQYASENGFDCIEISTSPGVHKNSMPMTFENIPEIKELLAKYNLKPFAVSGYNDFVQKDTEELARQIEKLENTCKLAREVSAKVVRAFGGEVKEGINKKDTVKLIIEGFKEATKRAEKLGIILGLENHGEITNDARVELDILEGVGSDYLRLTVDTSNYYWYGNKLEDIEEFFKLVAPYTVHTHLKDGSTKNGIRDNYISLALGEGEINLKLFLTELKDNGYSNPLCIEYEGIEDPKIGLKKGFIWLKNTLKEIGWEV